MLFRSESAQDIAVLREHRSRPLGSTTLHFGDVRLSWQVTGYLRRDETTHEVLDSTPLDCPEHTLTTQAVWWSVPETLERELGWGSLRLGAAAHAAEDEGASVGGAFTQNRFCAAPVQVCREHLQGGQPIRALVINTGNANAGTGAQGRIDAIEICAATAEQTGCKPSQVLPFSTGVILRDRKSVV